MLIYLKNHKEAVLTAAKKRNRYSYLDHKLLEEAVEAQANNELRYNRKTGKTYSVDRGLCAEHISSIPKYETTEQAAIEEFVGWVRNSADRKRRGYSIL